MRWYGALSSDVCSSYLVVLITSRSPTMRVVPPLPMNWALFVFQLPAVRDAKAMLLTTVFAPPPVVIVSLTRSEERRVGEVLRYRVPLDPSKNQQMLPAV